MNIELSDYDYILSKKGKIVGHIDTVSIDDMLNHIIKYLGDDLKVVNRLILELEFKNESLIFSVKDDIDYLLNNLIKKDSEAIVGFKLDNKLTEKELRCKLIAVI